MVANNVISIQINSIHRDTGSSLSNPLWSNFNVDDIEGYRIKNVVMPSSFYTIDSRNNKIYFNEDSYLTTTLTATIASGYYTSSTILTAINTALDAVGVSNTYLTTYTTLTNKITITASTEDFRVVSGINNAYYELGIDTSDLSVLNTIFTPNSQIDLSGVKMVNILSNYLGNLKIANTNFKILTSIVLEESSGSISTYENHDSEYIKVSLNEIQNISLMFYDERMRRLDEGIKDYSITFSFLIE